MAYNPLVDFFGLLRQTGGGVRATRAPGLDVVVSAMSRAGLFAMLTQVTAPTANQAKTAWFQPASPSWANEGKLFLWNAATTQYEPATAALFLALLQAS